MRSQARSIVLLERDKGEDAVGLLTPDWVQASAGS